MPQIGYKQILQALSKIDKYKPLCKLLLSLPSLRPKEGKNIDPAHEAIHPTVEPPSDIKKLSTQEQNIYDLVCRRFLSTFAEDAIKESTVGNHTRLLDHSQNMAVKPPFSPKASLHQA
jgi:DNA topoisomerase IA